MPLIIIGLTFAAVFVLMATRPRLTPVETPEKSWPVDVVRAEHRTLQPNMELFGEVVAGRRSELRPLVSGLIVEVGKNFREGGFVEAGELLLQIDPFDYEIALAEQNAQLKEARAKLEKLRRDHERARELYGEKNVSEQFLDDAKLAVVEQESIVEQREIGMRRAEKDLRETRLTAPFSGVVKDVNADLGKQVTDFGDQKVAEIIDTSRVEVRFSLSNAQYGRLLESGEPVIGRPVTVVWAVGDEALQFDATIARVGAQIASTTGGIDVFAVIETGGRQTRLRPGAFVEVRVPDKQFADVMPVPDSALYDGDRVYVVEDDRLVARRVNILGYAGDTMLIRAAGEEKISDGALIVVTQLREAGPGSRVVVR